ncbi:hypothetical protein JCM19240_179 [Vibrio maritimus]|uniref:Uncharacterized protein n=1 Tax=Vibrio maritimus TaxID=990268 RepID=A0A090TCU9_9VIBR|nr:hypothetical protein JCM19240_179 [Vibrio maritimus]
MQKPRAIFSVAIEPPPEVVIDDGVTEALQTLSPSRLHETS